MASELKDIEGMPIHNANPNDKITMETGFIGGKMPSIHLQQSMKSEHIPQPEDNNDPMLNMASNLNINQELQKLKTPIPQPNINSSINLDDFHSAKSVMLEDLSHSSINFNTSSNQAEHNLPNNISNCFSQSQTLTINVSSSITQDPELIELYRKMKELISNEQYDQLNLLTKDITAYETTMRKNWHEEKMAQIKEIEETMKKQTIEMIQAKKTKKQEELFLINAKSDEGYSIITKKDLEKDYDLMEFKDYEYYYKKQKNQ